MISKLASIEEEKTPMRRSWGKEKLVLSGRNLSGKLNEELLNKLDHVDS